MTDTSSNNKRLAKNTLFLYFRTIVILLISLYTSRVVLQALGEVDFGIYNLVGGIVVLFSFMNGALSTATQRYLSYELGKSDEREANHIFCMSLSIHILLSAFVLILGETIGLWFVETQLNIPEERNSAAFWVYQFSLIGCCASILRVPFSAVIVAYENFSFYTYTSVLDAILRLAIVFALFLFIIDKLVLYAILMCFVIFVFIIIYYFYCTTNYSICRYKFIWDRSLFRELLSFSGWSMFGSFANISANQGLNMLLNIFCGVILNAAVGIATQVQGALASFIYSFQSPLSPQIVKAYASNDRKYFFDLISNSSRLSYALVFIFGPAIIVCLDPILSVWLTTVPKYTKQIVTLYILFVMIDAMSGPLWISVQATGNIRTYQMLMSILILLNLPIMMFLLYLRVSPVIVVAVRPILNLLTHLIRIVYLKRNILFPSRKYWKDVMLRCMIMSILCLPLSLFLMERLNDRSYFWGLVAFAAIVIQNAILVMVVGIKSGEREAIFRFVYNRLPIR